MISIGYSAHVINVICKILKEDNKAIFAARKPKSTTCVAISLRRSILCLLRGKILRKDQFEGDAIFPLRIFPFFEAAFLAKLLHRDILK